MGVKHCDRWPEHSFGCWARRARTRQMYPLGHLGGGGSKRSDGAGSGSRLALMTFVSNFHHHENALLVVPKKAVLNNSYQSPADHQNHLTSSEKWSSGSECTSSVATSPSRCHGFPMPPLVCPCMSPPLLQFYVNQRVNILHSERQTAACHKQQHFKHVHIQGTLFRRCSVACMPSAKAKFSKMCRCIVPNTRSK